MQLRVSCMNWGPEMKSLSLPREQHKCFMSLNCPGRSLNTKLIKYVERELSYSSYFSKYNCASEKQLIIPRCNIFHSDNSSLWQRRLKGKWASPFMGGWTDCRVVDKHKCCLHVHVCVPVHIGVCVNFP